MTNQKKLQIFVSSTYTDLRAERQAAVEAILKAGHIPAGMELFSAGSESQLETIRRWIDDSDVYMLILGGRYGSVDAATSLSYTELEYDYALSVGKPIFSVVMTEEGLEARVKAHGTEVMEKEHPRELRFFREKVLDKISSFFDDAKDIKLAVHETLADYSRRLEFTGWVSGRDVVDTKPLLEEIAGLRNERDKLQAQLDQARKAAVKPRGGSSNEWSDEELGEVSALLRGIDVSTKAFTSDKSEGPVSYSMLHIFSALRDKLITGVSNSAGVGDGESFLFFNVFPKLEIYGLASLEKVAGVRWQRYRLSPKGMALLAFLDREKLKLEVKSGAPESSGKA